MFGHPPSACVGFHWGFSAKQASPPPNDQGLFFWSSAGNPQGPGLLGVLVFGFLHQPRNHALRVPKTKNSCCGASRVILYLNFNVFCFQKAHKNILFGIWFNNIEIHLTFGFSVIFRGFFFFSWSLPLRPGALNWGVSSLDFIRVSPVGSLAWSDGVVDFFAINPGNIAVSDRGHVSLIMNLWFAGGWWAVDMVCSTTTSTPFLPSTQCTLQQTHCCSVKKNHHRWPSL